MMRQTSTLEGRDFGPHVPYSSLGEGVGGTSVCEDPLGAHGPPWVLSRTPLLLPSSLVPTTEESKGWVVLYPSLS